MFEYFEERVDVDEAVLVETVDIVVQDECLLLESLEYVVAAPLDSHDGFHFVLNDLILFDDGVEGADPLTSESTRCGHKSLVVEASMVFSPRWSNRELFFFLQKQC